MADGKRERLSTANATKCTPALIAEVIAAVGHGTPVNAAFGAQGIPRQTLSLWRDNAAAGREPFVTALADVARAVDLCTAAMVRDVADAMKAIGRDSDGGSIMAADPQTRQWLLERTRPEEFAPSTTVIVKAQHDATRSTLDVARRVLEPAQYALLLAALSEDDDAPADDVPAQH